MADPTPSDSSTAPIVPPVKKGAEKPAAKPALKSAPRIWFKDPVTGEQKLRGEQES